MSNLTAGFKYRISDDLVFLQAHNMPFQITYGTGRVAGFVGSDTVTLGSNPAVQVQRQGFGGVFDSSMDFLSASCDGLFVSPFFLLLPLCMMIKK